MKEVAIEIKQPQGEAVGEVVQQEILQDALSPQKLSNGSYSSVDSNKLGSVESTQTMP